MIKTAAKRAVAAVVAASILVGVPGFRAVDAAAQVFGAAESARASSAATVRVVPGAALAPSLGASSFAPSFSFAPALTAPASLAAPSLSAPSLAPSALPSAALPTASLPSAAPAAVPIAAPAAAPLAAALPVLAAASAPETPASGGDAKSSPERQASESGRTFDQSAARPASDDAATPGTESSAPNGLTPAPKGKSKIPRPLWGLFWGHDITTVLGINFHILSQPFLVQNTLGMGTAAMGLVRNIHMGSMAIVNFLPVGYLIDKTDYRVVAIATAAVRALLMGAIPLLFSAGLLHFWVLAAIVALNPLFQSTMIVAEGAAQKTILGKDEKLNKDATATFSKWDSLAGMLMPLAAGWAVGALVSAFGLGGYAMAYGLYAGLLLASIPIYWAMVRDPRFPAHDKLGPVEFSVQGATFVGALFASMVHPLVAVLRWSYASIFPGERSSFPAPNGAPAGERLRRIGAALLWVGREALVALAGAALLPLSLLKLLKALPASLRAARAENGGKKGYERAAAFLDRYKPMQGLAYILRNKTLRVLTGVMALEVFLADALPFVVIPSLITEVLGKAPAGLPGFMATAGGLMGVLYSIEYLGRFLPSLKLEGEKGDALIEKVGHGRFYKRAALGSLLFWAMLAPIFLTPGLFWVNLAIVAASMFGVQYFNTGVGIVLAPVKRAEMDDDKLARIESASFMVDVAFESVGALLLGLLMDFAGLKVALIVAASFLTFTSVLQWKVPGWIFPDGNRPAKKNP